MDEPRSGRSENATGWLWIAFVTVASLGLSRAFGCVTPFAAVAATAAMTLPKRRAAVLVLLVWLGNQAIGFGLMHYPHTSSTYGWGVAIGLAAIVSLGAAWSSGHRWQGAGLPVEAALSLVAAYTAYEGVLVAATLVLPSGSAAFEPLVVLRCFGIDAAALGLLLAVYRLARAASACRLRTDPARPLRKRRWLRISSLDRSPRSSVR